MPHNNHINYIVNLITENIHENMGLDDSEYIQGQQLMAITGWSSDYLLRLIREGELAVDFGPGRPNISDPDHVWKEYLPMARIRRRELEQHGVLTSEPEPFDADDPNDHPEVRVGPGI